MRGIVLVLESQEDPEERGSKTYVREYMTAQEVCKLIGLTRRTMNEWSVEPTEGDTVGERVFLTRRRPGAGVPKFELHVTPQYGRLYRRSQVLEVVLGKGVVLQPNEELLSLGLVRELVRDVTGKWPLSATLHLLPMVGRYPSLRAAYLNSHVWQLFRKLDGPPGFIVEAVALRKVGVSFAAWQALMASGLLVHWQQHNDRWFTAAVVESFIEDPIYVDTAAARYMDMEFEEFMRGCAHRACAAMGDSLLFRRSALNAALQMRDADSGLLATPDVLKALYIGENQLKRYAQLGIITPVRHGASNEYRIAQVERLMANPFIFAREVARLLGTDPNGLTHIPTEVLPVYRVAGRKHVRYRLRDVQALVGRPYRP